LAALIAQALPGRTAVVWLPQFANVDEAEQRLLAVDLYAQLRPALVARGVHLVQALESCSDRRAAELLENSGFSHAADLLYLGAEASSFPDHPPPVPFAMERFEPAMADRLKKTIDQSYEGTLDCPRMDGLRETDDVIAGYLAIGEFRAELWRIIRDGAADVGCLLVNLHPDAKHAEIVYLGLVPAVRGRGVAVVARAEAHAGARPSPPALTTRIRMAVGRHAQPRVRASAVSAAMRAACFAWRYA